MIAGLIFVISVAALLQFFVSYCRSVIAASRKVDLSTQAREAIGIQDRAVSGEEFTRLLQLVGLCPEPGNDRFEIRAVRNYYLLLSLLRAAMHRLAPGVTRWADDECAGCAHFAAVALDRRIAFSRGLMAQQMANRL
jgi:hypothetical protein